MAENNLQENGRLVYAKGHMIGAFSGLLAGIAANGILGAIRNIGPQELIIDNVEMAFYTTTPIAAAASRSQVFAWYKVPLTALSNAGARGTAPVPVRKRTLDHFVLLPTANAGPVVRAPEDTFVAAQVANTTVLTGATITGGIALFQDDPMDVLVCNTQTAAASIIEGQTRWEPKNGIPFTLEPDEGLIFTARTAFEGALAGVFNFNADVRIA